MLNLKPFIFLLLVTLLSCNTYRHQNTYSSKQMQLPQIMQLNTNEKFLLYLGTYHSNNPKDSLFEIIKNNFQSFKPDFVLYEGNNWPIYQNIDSTIMISGEPGFIISLCKSNNIQTASLEPNEADEYKKLIQEFGIDWTVLMYVCRQIDQQQRFMKLYKTTDEQFEKNISYLLTKMKDNGVPLVDKQLYYPYWRKKYQELLKRELDWRTFNPIEYYPNYDVTKLNEVNRTSDNFRNEFMIQLIMDKLNNNKKVMVVVGGGHLHTQQKELELRFNKLFRN